MKDIIHNRRNLAKLLVIAVIILIAVVANVPPNAEFMPEDKRYPYYTFPLLPPLIAIVLCMITGEVLPSLFIGIWIGALMITAYNPISASLKVASWLIDNATDPWNATILLFDFVIGAWIGLLYTSGALHSAAEALIKRVRSARGVSIASSVLGVLVFFDDYTNTIVVGNTMRPVADKLRVSRELLSYIVDTTAAPVAGLFLVSTWIGYEVSQIRGAIDELIKEVTDGKIPVAPDTSPYSMWLGSVPYHFYSILALILLFTVVITRRHFGPMLQAEHRAVAEGKVLRDTAVPMMPTEEVLNIRPSTEKRVSGWIFVTSSIILIVVALIGIWMTGAQGLVEDSKPFWEVSFIDSIQSETVDAASALFWASLAAYFVTLGFILATRAMSLNQSMKATIRGMYLMVYANAILLLAWTIKTVVDTLGTASYVVGVAREVGLPATFVPLLIYVVSMFISFNTGTSWGTFGIMMPIAVPMAWKLSMLQYPGDIALAYTITLASIGAVFGGGIFGDHCSPISDTTIMSSMFSGCDHIDHVKTQMPYALLAGITGILLYGLFAIGLMSPVVLIIIGVVLVILLHRLLSNYYAKRVKLQPIVPNYKL
ncbi:MAG: Na+/H+ antiporter NhaC family protein [Desulfurococcaceae archaeon]